MSTTYTPTPAALPATLELPQDAVEAVIVETVNTNTAILADAILNAEQVAIPTASAPAFFRRALESGTTGINDFIGLEFDADSQSVSSSGDSYGAGVTAATNTGGASGDHVRMVGAGTAGVWSIMIKGTFQVDSASDPTNLELVLVQHPNSDPNDGDTAVDLWMQTRFSTNASGLIFIEREYKFVHPGGDGLRFSIRNVSGADVTTLGGTEGAGDRSYLYVTQLSRLAPP